MLTELEAVNIMLSAIGQSPVSTVESLHPDVLSSVLLLKHARMQALHAGKWFNTEESVTLHVNASGEIVLPSTCLSVDPVDTSRNYVKRSSKLYNVTDHTFKFPAAVVVNMTVDMPFSELPFVAQNLVVLNAALILQANFVGDDRKLQVLTARLAEAQRAFNAEELAAGDYNVKDAPYVRRLLQGIRAPFRVLL